MRHTPSPPLLPGSVNMPIVASVVQYRSTNPMQTHTQYLNYANSPGRPKSSKKQLGSIPTIVTTYLCEIYYNLETLKKYAINFF